MHTSMQVGVSGLPEVPSRKRCRRRTVLTFEDEERPEASEPGPRAPGGEMKALLRSALRQTVGRVAFNALQSIGVRGYIEEYEAEVAAFVAYRSTLGNAGEVAA